MSDPSKPIQGPLPGFLSLLSLKNLGQLPDTLQGNVQPVLDLGGYFLRGQAIPMRSTCTVPLGATPGGFVGLDGTGGLAGTDNFTVPQNEVWYVENFTGVTSQLSNTDVIFFTPGFNRPSPNSYHKVGPEVGAAGVGAGSVIVGHAQNFWVPSGCVLGYWIGSQLVAAETLLWSLMVTRLTK